MNPAVLRAAIIDVRQQASLDLAELFRRVTTAAQALEALADILPALIEQYGAAAATLAAEWYDEARDRAGVRGTFAAIPAEVGDRGVQPLISWGMAPAFALLDAARPGGVEQRPPAQRPPAQRAPANIELDDVTLRLTLTRIDGGMTRRISDVGRETVMGSAVADPRARGWQRYASGGCAFCVMLAARGGVYTARTADFAAHDKCRCTAAPAFEGVPVPVKPYTPTTRNISDADRARVRAYLAANPAADA